MKLAIARRVFLWMSSAGLLGPSLAWAGVATARAAEALLFGVDVAADSGTRVFRYPRDNKGQPANGAPFIIQGYIYPWNTLIRHGPKSGLLEDGSPEFPDQVMGRWYCKGWYINRAARATTGPYLTTTQIFDLNSAEVGAETLVTEGLELAQFNVSTVRPVTGGSGRFRLARGVMKQTALAYNRTGARNLTYEFDLTLS
jgi:hypothetical protein